MLYILFNLCSLICAILIYAGFHLCKHYVNTLWYCCTCILRLYCASTFPVFTLFITCLLLVCNPNLCHPLHCKTSDCFHLKCPSMHGLSCRLKWAALANKPLLMLLDTPNGVVLASNYTRTPELSKAIANP